MKTGRSLTDWASEIERQANAKRDFVVDIRQLSITEPYDRARDHTEVPAEQEKGLQLSIGDHTSSEFLDNADHFDIGQTAHRQIGERTKIPAKYYDRMLTEKPSLLADNVNTWLHAEPKRRMVRTLDGTARALLSDRYQRIDNYDVANVAMPILQEVKDLEIKSCEVTERKMYLKVVSPRVRGEVKRGDEVQAGLVISNSEIGYGSVNIQPMVFRLVCLNGMILPSVLKKYHIGAQVEAGELQQLLTDETLKADDNVVLMKIRDVVQGVLDATNFEAYIDGLRETTEHKMEGNPAKAIEVLGKSHGLNEAEQGGVLRHLASGGDLTQYGLINAVTAFSQDVEDYDRATELEAMGGKLVDLSSDQWTEIAQAA